MRNISYTLALTFAIATMVIGLFTLSSPYTLAAVGFIVWAMSPYGYLTLLIKLVSSKAATIAALVIAIITSVFGLGLLIDTMFIHLDAQGGLIYIFAPLWQWVGLLILSIPVFILNKAHNA